MLEQLMDLMHFAVKQKLAVYDLIATLKSLSAGGFSIKKFFAGIMAFVEIFICVAFGGARTPVGQSLDLTGYDLVFCDEFDGDSLNTDVWGYRASGPRRFGFNAESQVSVHDGNLYLTGEYLENGTYGEGWYSGMISLKQHYLRGYYEIRCICNEDKGFWSAFWLQSGNAYSHEKSAGGIGGCEIDIFEAMSADKFLPGNKNSVEHNIHCNGVDDDVENIDSMGLGKFKANNIYKEYNTYGLEWTEDEYIFYINGVESARSTWGKGVSTVPEEVIVSLEIPGELNFEKDYKTQMIVDYVKIYQK